ncbi:phenazine biosynthesis-like domain-containing protein [Sycon ciliatum]|uniref:phenazine biosynthesis-like domain-containing protein n=1 Tax=Sycon ciliatum TaxID=27933 RepID=UPI0031F6DD7D
MSDSCSLPMFTVDSFTDTPFSGNPAAVCLLSWEFPEHLMQPIAREMNLSETAFIERLNAADDFRSSRHFKLRWLTPTCEVNLCGHATLAAAAVLFKALENPADVITFSTLSGQLKAKRDGEKICLDLPLNEPEPQDIGLDSNIQQLVLGSDLPLQEVFYSAATKKLVLRLPDSVSRGQLEALPVPNQLRMLESHDASRVRGVIVTIKSCSDDKYDFFSRYFAPWNGIAEDPVTGSAHTVLAPYWAKQLGVSRPLNARQVSPRGGDLVLRIAGDRLEVLGAACVVMKGELLLPAA